MEERIHDALIDDALLQWVREISDLLYPMSAACMHRLMHLEVMSSMFGKFWAWGMCLKKYAKCSVECWTVQFGSI